MLLKFNKNKTMLTDIQTLINIINDSLSWANEFKIDTFPSEEVKEIRRKVKRIAGSLKDNCAAAAYGESQVGKSYLMSSLLSTPKSPFVINNDGTDYNFIYDINPSGGNNTKTESTGIITRFTINPGNSLMKKFVKVKNLSIADIIMLLVDSYYNDLKIDTSKVLSKEAINSKLQTLKNGWRCDSPVQTDLEDDDIKDISDYISEVIGSNAISIQHSDFNKVVSKNIKYIDYVNWTSVFSLLWNNNEEISRLFSFLIQEYEKIKFQTEVYVPFDSVLQKNGTLLKIEWLDSVLNPDSHKTKTDKLDTTVYDCNNNVIAKSFKKASLSALIAEITFVLPEEIAKERPFLKKIDLLDFPGARAREKIDEREVHDIVLPIVLRRGKVAYLFNKYARSLNISSILFCHHNDQKTEPSLGNRITNWLEENIGKTPKERTKSLKETNDISPLFFIATKFNIELQKTPNDKPGDKQALNEHWKRFKTTIPEIIKPAKWFDKWTLASAELARPFQHIYLLRDFYWSGQNRVFDGYSDRNANHSEETNIHKHSDYPNFLNDLRNSFLDNDFVKKHFFSPDRAWNDVATLNEDGSRAIISDLNKISNVLDQARSKRYLTILKQFHEDILAKLNTYYEPEDKQQNINRIRKIIGSIRLQLDGNVGEHPEVFGKIIDQVMLPIGNVRDIVYDIVVLKTETPRDLNAVTLIRTTAGIDSNDDPETNIRKLLNYYACSLEDLKKEFKNKGFTVDDVIAKESTLETTVADVVTNRILDYWNRFLNEQVKIIKEHLPHANEIAFMLQVLCKKLTIDQVIKEKIDTYTKLFDNEELPNPIADFASLTLDNFVSSVGREYLTNADIETIKDKAAACELEINIPPQAHAIPRQRINLEEVLKALDKASNQDFMSSDTLKKLPFWSNYLRWKNLVEMGLLYTSDVSQYDPIANNKMKELINKCEFLYKD